MTTTEISSERLSNLIGDPSIMSFSEKRSILTELRDRRASAQETPKSMHVEGDVHREWQGKPQSDLEQAIVEFKAALPGWWYSVCECDHSCDASCGPTIQSEHIKLIRTNEKGLVLSLDDPFDSGFHVDIPQPSSLAQALRHIMGLALVEIEARMSE